MKSLIVAAALVLAAFTSLAFADPGGLPNQNASTQIGKGNPQGRKGSCVPPGDIISQFANDEGSVPDAFGTPPGETVDENCTPE
jgi:hypothetical protein